MKGSQSAFGSGLWIAGGIAAVYLLGFAVLIYDLSSSSSRLYLSPEEVQDAIFAAYWPLGLRVIRAP